MKTAVQQAIDQIQEQADIYEGETPSVVRGALLYCREICKSLLPTEREQIEEAFMDGEKRMAMAEFGETTKFLNANDYYNKTYNNEVRI